MEYSFEDRRDILYLKNTLIHGSEEELKKLFSSQEDYALFLDTFNIALDSENTLFILDDSILKKAEEVLYSKRFVYNDPDFVEITNEIIRSLNKIKNIPENYKDLYRRQYVEWQSKVRETSFTSKEDLLCSLAYDAILIEKLAKGELGEIDSVYFFASTNYLAKMLPELYQTNESYVDLTLQRLQKHAGKKWIWNWAERDFAKHAISNVQKVKIKEE